MAGGELLLQLPEDGGLRVVLRLPPATLHEAAGERASAEAGAAAGAAPAQGVVADAAAQRPLDVR